MEKNIIIAPVGDSPEALFIGIRDYPTERVILLSPPYNIDRSEKIKNDLERFHIPTRIMEIKGDIWEGMFQKISEIKELEKGKNLIVNASTGDRNMQCAATSAAFVNGLKAFAVMDNETMLLPVMKFSYYSILTDKKMSILKVLDTENCCSSLEELSRKAKMSLPLISYHIHGNRKSEGLKGLGLIDINNKSNKVDVKLSMLGRLLLKGYVKHE